MFKQAQYEGIIMINNEKIFSRIRYSGISLFKLFGSHTSRSREYDFIMNNVSHSEAVILDMGSVGSFLPLNHQDF